jgi:hypothetical protein
MKIIFVFTMFLCLLTSCKKDEDKKPFIGCVKKVEDVTEYSVCGYRTLRMEKILNNNANYLQDTLYHFQLLVNRSTAKLDKACNEFDLTKDNGVSLAILVRAPGSKYDICPHNAGDTVAWHQPGRVYPIKGNARVWVSKRHLYNNRNDDPNPEYYASIYVYNLEFPEDAIGQPEILTNLKRAAVYQQPVGSFNFIE